MSVDFELNNICSFYSRLEFYGLNTVQAQRSLIKFYSCYPYEEFVGFGNLSGFSGEFFCAFQGSALRMSLIFYSNRVLSQKSVPVCVCNCSF